MRTRKYDWLDLSTRKPLYGFQIYVQGEWMNAAEGGKPLLFATPEERDTKRANLRKMSVRDTPPAAVGCGTGEGD